MYKKNKSNISLMKILAIIPITFLLILPVSLAFEEVDCFEDYEFDVGIQWLDFFPDKAAYSPGDDIIMSYTTKSVMRAPVVEGRERVQIFYNHPTRGEEMIDEFFVDGELNLMEGHSIRRGFTWTLPENIPTGEYLIKIYSIVGDTYNLGGLSMVPYGPPGVPGEMVKFNVVDGSEEYVYFDKKDTSIDNEPYLFGNFVPSLETGIHTVTTELVGKGSISLEKEIYAWDDISGRPLKKEQEAIDLNGTEIVRFTLPSLEPNAYEIRFTATYPEGKAMLKVRVGVEGSHGRFIFNGLTDFPLEAGKPVGTFVCMSNSADHSSWVEGSGVLKIYDETGNEVYSEDFGSLSVPPVPYGIKGTFTPEKDMQKLTVEVTLRSDSGYDVDTQTLVYDYSKFLGVDAVLETTIKERSINQGDFIDYTVSLKDINGIPLEGNIFVYLLGPDESVIYAEEMDMQGSYEGKLKAVSGFGLYTLKVKDPLRNLEAEDVARVIEEIVQPEEADYTLWLGLVAIIIVMAVIFMMMTRRKR